MEWSPRLVWLFLGDKKEWGLTAAQVSMVTGVDPTTIQNWSNRGLVEPFPVKGKGDPRVFGTDTVVHITLANEMLRLGLAPRSAFAAAELTWGAFLEVIGPRLVSLSAKGKTLSEEEFERYRAAITSGPRSLLAVEILTDDTTPEHDLVLVFRFGPILLNMATQVMSISKTGTEKPMFGRVTEASQLEVVLNRAAKRTSRRRKTGKASS